MNRVYRYLGILTALVFTPGCQTAPAAAAAHGENGNMKKLEKLQSIEIGRDSLSITVISTGCTSAEDFTVESSERGDHGELAIYRIKPDYCRRAPMPVTLTLQWENTTGTDPGSLQVVNPVLRHSPSSTTILRPSTR